MKISCWFSALKRRKDDARRRKGPMENQRGSALVWSLAVVMILMILVTGILGVSLGYQTRSLNNNFQQQAYYTAKSAVDLLAEKINVNNLQLTPDAGNPVIEVTDIQFDSGMGTCTARIELREDGMILITAAAAYGKQSYTLSLSLTRASGSWEKYRYMYEGQELPPSTTEATTSTTATTMPTTVTTTGETTTTTTTTEPTTTTTTSPSFIKGTVGEEITEKKPGNDKGEYDNKNNSPAYKEGDFVFIYDDQGNKVWYRAVIDVPGGHKPDEWSPGGTVCYLWKRITTAYDPYSVYLVGDIIQYTDGKYYQAIARAADPTHPPPSAPSVWQEVVYQGDGQWGRP